MPFCITSRQRRFVVALEDLRRPAKPLFEQAFENTPDQVRFALVLWSDAERSTWSFVRSDRQRGAMLVGAGDLGTFAWPSESVDNRSAYFAAGSSWHWLTAHAYMSLALYEPCDYLVSFNGSATDILAERLAPRPTDIPIVNRRLIYTPGSELSRLLESDLPLERWPEPVWRISVQVAH